MLRWDSRRASTATVLKRKSKANTEKGNPGKSSLSIYGILLKMTKGTNVKSVWNQNERKQLILTDDHNTFSTTNWVDLTLNRWGQKRTHAKIHPVLAARLHGVSSPAGELLRQSCRCSDSAQVGCLKFPIEILQCTNLVRRQQRMVNRQQRWHGLRPRRQAVLAEWSSQDARAQCACQTHKESEQHITAASKSAGFLFAVSAGGRLLVRFATFCMLLPI